MGECEEEAHVTCAILDAVNGNIDDAVAAFESINSVVSYWNLALVSGVALELNGGCFKT